MTDYSVVKPCQWCKQDGKQCSRRARFLRGRTIWLCNQHFGRAVDMTIADIEPHLMRRYQFTQKF